MPRCGGKEVGVDPLRPEDEKPLGLALPRAPALGGIPPSPPRPGLPFPGC